MKEYILRNLDCANCAAKIEAELQKQPFVKKANINFAIRTLKIDTSDLKKVDDIIQRIEPGVELVEKKKDAEIEEFSPVKEIIFTLIALAVFIAGLVVKHYYADSAFGWTRYLLFGAAYLMSGYEVLYKAIRNIFHGQIFDENFLMTISTIGAFIIGAQSEAVGVMLFYRVGEFFEDMALHRSRKSIHALLSIQPDSANLVEASGIKVVSPADVAIGSVVLVRPGEKIPLDGEVIEGESQVDTSALTGESLPRKAGVGDMVLAGTINKNGLIKVRVNRLLENSSISKMLELVENASAHKAKTENFITVFARYYTPVVVVGAVLVAAIPPLFAGGIWTDWIYRALILLVISCPCALVISIPLGYFGGIGGASRKGILVKGSNYLDALTKVSHVVFDKTGTLTHGVFKVIGVKPYNNFTENDLLILAAEAEEHSSHPIAQSIREAYGRHLSMDAVSDYEEIGGAGVRAVVNGKLVLVGNDRLMHRYNIEHDTCEQKGTVVHVAVDENYAGFMNIGDELKEDSLLMIKELKGMGITPVMLTGDNRCAARDIATELGIDEYYAELLPENKVEEIEKLMLAQNKKGAVAFVGDGINDAPVIARADVGIAMGAGSDAAIDTADVVLMNDSPLKIVTAIKIARRTRLIVYENIIFALGIKFAFMALGVFGIATMWEAVFADIGVAIIAILNASRALRSRD